MEWEDYKVGQRVLVTDHGSRAHKIAKLGGYYLLVVCDKEIWIHWCLSSTPYLTYDSEKTRECKECFT